MKHEKILEEILRELTVNAEQISAEELEYFADALCAAKHIFVAGAGRSGFAARAFSNRLMHLGLAVSFVGEPTTPAISPEMYLLLDLVRVRQEALWQWRRKRRNLVQK